MQRPGKETITETGLAAEMLTARCPSPW